MPQIQRGAIAGCCVGCFFYDLGGAHGKYRSRSLDEFAMKMIQLGMNRVNIALTNREQGPEREYLEALGFEQKFTEGGMYVHIVGSAVLDKNLAKYKEILKKKQEEEAAKKREQEEARRKAAEEKARLAKEEKEKREKVDMAALLETAKPNDEDVTLKWVQDMYNRFPTMEVKTVFEGLYGFKTFPEYVRKWHDTEIVESINRRLKRRRDIAAGVEVAPAKVKIKTVKKPKG